MISDAAADRIALAFLERYWDDHDAGRSRTLADYQAMFPGHEGRIEAEFAAVHADGADASVDGEERRLGPYRLLEEIGRGGQATVWRAKDSRLGRTVAVKVLKGMGAMSPELMQRFRREAEVASRLDHPGICPVFEMEVDRGVPYIAMRYIEGETLAQRLASERRSRATPAASYGPGSESRTDREQRELARVFEDLARAVHCAHEAGIVHRDIKPGNLMLPHGDSQPVVLDFGLAGDDRAVEGLTVTNEQFGTPAYMSPEQIAGAGHVDRRTDIYSLGCALYECLALRAPFAAPTRQALYQAILHDEPESLRRGMSSIPADLAAIVEVAMEKDLARRYQTAADLAEDLRRFREHEPVLARPTPRLLRLRRWSQRNPTVAAVLVFVVIALIAAAVMLDRLAAEQASTATALRTAEASNLVKVSAESMTEDPMLALLLAREAVAREQNPETSSHLLVTLAEELPLAQWRSEADDNRPWVAAAIADDGSRVAAVRSNTSVSVWARGDTTALATLAGDSPIQLLTIGPAGLVLQVGWCTSPMLTHIATWHEDGAVRFWAEGDSGWETVTTIGEVTRMTALPSRQGLALAIGNSVRTTDWRGDFQPRQVTANAQAGAIRHVAVAPSGRIAAWHDNGWITMQTADGVRSAKVTAAASAPGLPHCIDLAGDWVAYCLGDRVQLWHQAEPAPRTTLNLPGACSHLELDVAGRRLLTFHDMPVPGARLWDLEEWVGEQPHFAELPLPGANPRLALMGRSTERHLSADGRFVFTLHARPLGGPAAEDIPGEHGALGLWDSHGGIDAELRWLEDIDSGMFTARFPQADDGVSPTWLLAVATKGQLQRLDLETGRTIGRFVGHQNGVRAALADDGNHVATASHDGSVRLWQARDHELQRALTHHDLAWLHGATGSERFLTVSAFGREAGIHVVDGTTRRRLDHAVPTFGGLWTSHGNAALSPDGILVVLGSPFGGSGARIVDLENDDAAVDFVPRQKVDLVTMVGNDRVAVVWYGPQGVFDPAIGVNLFDEQRLRLISLPTREQVDYRPAREHGQVLCLAGAANGTCVALGYQDGTIDLVSHAGVLLDQLSAPSRTSTTGWHNQVAAVTISSDGNRVIVGYSGGGVRVWAADGNTPPAPAGHRDRVWALTCSADGSRAASSSILGDVRVWDVATGDSLLFLRPRTPIRGGIHWRSDNRLLTHMADGTVRAWPVDTDDILDLADRRTIRTFTAAERDRHRRQLDSSWARSR